MNLLTKNAIARCYGACHVRARHFKGLEKEKPEKDCHNNDSNNEFNSLKRGGCEGPWVRGFPGLFPGNCSLFLIAHVKD